MNPISKFGFFLLSLSSTLVLVYKFLVHYHLYTQSSAYGFLHSYSIVFPFVFAIAMLLVFSVYAKSFILLIIFFVIFLLIGFMVVSPFFIGG